MNHFPRVKSIIVCRLNALKQLFLSKNNLLTIKTPLLTLPTERDRLLTPQKCPRGRVLTAAVSPRLRTGHLSSHQPQTLCRVRAPSSVDSINPTPQLSDLAFQ